MIYILAITKDTPGCTALRMQDGKIAAALVTYLGLKTLSKGIDVMTVSDPESFGEYRPYCYVQTEMDFISYVLGKIGAQSGVPQ